jgi:exopolysaccharide production protein ExoQ
MALSVIWSEITPLSLRELISALLVWLACIALATRLSISQIRSAVIIYSGFTMVLGLVCEILLSTCHPLTSGYRFSGTVYANIQGVICSIFIISLLSVHLELLYLRIARGGALLFAFTLLILTQSRDSIVALFAAGLVIGLCSWTRRHLVFLFTGVSLFCTLLLVLFLLTLPGMTKKDLLAAATLDRDTVAANGVGDTRLAIWEECLPLLANHPILGYGYGAFWSEDRVSAMADHLGFIALHVHNGYLDTALNIGVIGCIVFVLTFFGALREYLMEYRRTRRRDIGFSAAVLVFFVSHLLFESFYVTGLETILALCVLMNLAFARGSLSNGPI